MAKINLFLSVMSLNINGLNLPKKDKEWQNGLKKTRSNYSFLASLSQILPALILSMGCIVHGSTLKAKVIGNQLAV